MFFIIPPFVYSYVLLFAEILECVNDQVVGLQTHHIKMTSGRNMTQSTCNKNLTETYPPMVLLTNSPWTPVKNTEHKEKSLVNARYYK